MNNKILRLEIINMPQVFNSLNASLNKTLIYKVNTKSK